MNGFDLETEKDHRQTDTDRDREITTDRQTGRKRYRDTEKYSDIEVRQGDEERDMQRQS